MQHRQPALPYKGRFTSMYTVCGVHTAVLCIVSDTDPDAWVTVELARKLNRGCDCSMYVMATGEKGAEA